MQPVSVLVVEDFEPFRQFTCSALRETSEFRNVGEASDGLEAIQKIEELRPDLILLDIGLPSLNGIRVAERARTIAPQAKLVFISQESSPDIIKETFRVGGRGYVLKSRAHSDLLPAIESVLKGRWFVSSGLEFSPEDKQEAPRRHEILFCANDLALLDGLSRFILTSLNGGNAVIALVRDEHKEPLLERLCSQNLDVETAIQQGSLIPCDVHDALSMFMVNDWPDPVRFSRAVSDLTRRAAGGSGGRRRRVVACGECAPTLWAEGKIDAAIQVEHLWDEITRSHGLDTLCLYPSLQDHGDDLAFKNLCAEHTAVYSR